jgi:ADP-ribosylglycohydrolase
MAYYLLGAIVGDACGAHYEFGNNRTKDYNSIKLIKKDNRFTDDTVCTIGVADAILKYKNPTVEQFAKCIQEWCKKYPNRGYGGRFRNWIDNTEPYESWGNGSAMRVSACGLASTSVKECIELAKNSAKCSHNSAEGVSGAVVTALAVYHARHNKNECKEYLKNIMEVFYPAYSELTLDELRPKYSFDSSCVGTVPVAMMCFLESSCYENCIKLAISMGGDADTLAAISGSVAYAYYEDMQKILMEDIINILPKEMMDIIKQFQ